jgi:uncharacterized protein (UPF0261 family)
MLEAAMTDRTGVVLLVVTMDTKGEEALYVRDCLREAGVGCLILDAGIRGKSPVPVEVGREDVARAGGRTLARVQAMGHEGKALNAMIEGAVRWARDLYQKGSFTGILGLGGSMGTTLGTAVMRGFPVGLPKVMITTMASRDTRAFVGTRDILMLHSVCDISGLNHITNRVLRNGAMAMAGMIRGARGMEDSGRPTVFVSTLGTSETCAQSLKRQMEGDGKEVVVFHTVGAGGQAMEEMIREEGVSALVDLSLHEICDHHFGGDYDAGPDRGAAALKRGVPTVLVPGNTDFLVTGPVEIARKRFPGRPFHSHNSAITVVRTERGELETLAGVVAGLCNTARGPWAILVPMKGLSAFDSPEGPLHDPEGPEILSDALKRKLDRPSLVQELPYHINDPDFSSAVIKALEGLLNASDVNHSS